MKEEERKRWRETAEEKEGRYDEERVCFVWPGNLERSHILSLWSDVGCSVQQTLPRNGIVGEPHKP